MTANELLDLMIDKVRQQYPNVGEFYLSELQAGWASAIEQLLEMDEIEVTRTPKMYRAGGDAICDVCQEPYYNHPPHSRPYAFAAEEITTFRRLCNGDLVKL